jgi:uncharacterized protein YegJ (DUF2314 family)
MNMIIWITVSTLLAIAAGTAAWWYRRTRRKSESRLVSLVALLREPMSIDPVILAKLAGRALHADLGDGISEGEDGFVCCANVINIITCRNQPFLVNCFAQPYVDDPQSLAEQIFDLRVRTRFAAHTGWVSFDALQADANTPQAEVEEYYRQLGRLLAEFVNDNCLLIMLPETRQVFTVNEHTDTALRAHDPLAALAEHCNLSPVVALVDDEQVEIAVAHAKETFCQFVSAFEERAGENFSIKTPLTYDDHTEFIWVSVTAMEGDRIYGELGNEPAELGPWKLGSKLSVLVADIQDWCYFDREGNLLGGFTVELVREAARRQFEAQTSEAART